MCARCHAAASYADDATVLHMGHARFFKIPGAIRHFCLRTYLHMCGPGTWKCQPCCVAESLQPCLAKIFLFNYYVYICVLGVS